MLVGIVGVFYSEPWPAFVLPGFKNVYATKGQVEITAPKFFVEWRDNSREEIAASELFPGLQASQMQGFIQSNFKKEDYHQKARDWLKNRLMQIYPDSSITALEIDWKTTIYQQAGDGVKTQDDQSTKTITIPFNQK
jgi:hypothetical protein